MYLDKARIEIREDKVKKYLLIFKDRNDKSGFLLNLGFSMQNWEELQSAIQEIALNNPAILQQETEFGSLYSINGILNGMPIITIWMNEPAINSFRFVTLYPDK